MQVLTTVSLSIVAGLAASAFAVPPRIEISEDGRQRVEVEPSDTDEQGWSIEMVVPIDTTADWSLLLRRQVGAVRIADLNNDGKNDLFVGCYISNSSPPYLDWHDMIFYNTGDPNAPLPASPSWISADQVHTGDAQIGDINGDGFLDVVAITGGTAFSPPRIYFGSATGPSTSPGWISSPPQSGWATGGLLFDVDGDGDLDLFTTNQGIAGIQPSDAWRPMYVHYNLGNGLETTPSWRSAEISIQNTGAAIDYDGDGDLDVAVSKWVNFYTAIYRNDGDSLEPTPIWTTVDDGADRGVAVADVDQNGEPDVGFGLDIGGTHVHTNVGGVLTDTYASDPPFDSHQEIALVDINHDNYPELVEVHFGDGRTHIYMNNAGSLSVLPGWTFDATEVGNAIALGDLNGDGWVDLAVGYSGNTSVRVFLATPQTIPCEPDLSGSSDPNNAAYGVPDGVVDASDFFYYLDQFAAGNVAVADLSGTSDPNDPGYGEPDGVLDASDFFYYLDQFAAGCP